MRCSSVEQSGQNDARRLYRWLEHGSMTHVQQALSSSHAASARQAHAKAVSSERSHCEKLLQLQRDLSSPAAFATLSLSFLRQRGHKWLLVLDRIRRCRWTLLPCSSQRWRRRASFWPDCSTELQHNERAPRQSSSPPTRLLVLAAFACACLEASANLPDRIRCRWALLPCSSQR